MSIRIGSVGCGALGRRYAEVIVDRLSRLATSMVNWDAATRHEYVRAERSLIAAQLAG